MIERREIWGKDERGEGESGKIKERRETWERRRRDG